jgi:DNA-directed RNA polymerase specialized sigma24 family protein
MTLIIEPDRSKSIRIIAWTTKTISPINSAHVAKYLERCDLRAGYHSHSTVDWFESLFSEADRFEAIQRKRYSAAVIRAALPEAYRGETYIRGWDRIWKYDSRRGALETWLHGIARRIRLEDERKSIAFRGEFDEIVANDLRGIDRISEICTEMTLEDVRREAIETCLSRRSKDTVQIIRAVLCEGLDREQVAQDAGKSNRNAIDQTIARLKAEARETAQERRQDETANERF